MKKTIMLIETEDMPEVFTKAGLSIFGLNESPKDLNFELMIHLNLFIFFLKAKNH